MSTTEGEVVLRSMSAEEYSSWREERVAFYAQHLVSLNEISLEEAMRSSEKAYGDLLPYGKDTPKNWLSQIVESGSTVGSLWLAQHQQHGQTTCWINDILIDEDKRSQGFGGRALAAAEAFARDAGYKEIGLEVFPDNQRAQKLYQRLGYALVADDPGYDLVADGLERLTMIKSLPS